MFDMNDPNTFWLNVTNIGLGLITLVCVTVVGYGIVQEVLVRFRKSQLSRVHEDDHAFVVSDLGITMADGGEHIGRKPLAVSENGRVIESSKKQKKHPKK
jgi:hypothetical protein